MIPICTGPRETVVMRLLRPVRLSLVGVLVSVLSCAFAPSASAMQGEKKQPAKMEEAQRLEAQALIALWTISRTARRPRTRFPCAGSRTTSSRRSPTRPTYRSRSRSTPARSPLAAWPSTSASSRRDRQRWRDRRRRIKGTKRRRQEGQEGRSQYTFEDLFFTDVARVRGTGRSDSAAPLPCRPATTMSTLP